MWVIKLTRYIKMFTSSSQGVRLRNVSKTFDLSLRMHKRNQNAWKTPLLIHFPEPRKIFLAISTCTFNKTTSLYKRDQFYTWRTTAKETLIHEAIFGINGPINRPCWWFSITFRSWFFNLYHELRWHCVTKLNERTAGVGGQQRLSQLVISKGWIARDGWWVSCWI